MTSLEAARVALHGGNHRSTSSNPRHRGPRAKRAKGAGSSRVAAAQTDTGKAPVPTEASDPMVTTDDTTPVRTAPSQKAARRSASTRGPRHRLARVQELAASKLEAMLRESADGLSAAAIVSRSGARDGQVRQMLHALESAGNVRRTGTGRGTRWRIVTDEERIAERAAELARRSSGSVYERQPLPTD